jgi:Ner family transcriptional regulator
MATNKPPKAVLQDNVKRRVWVLYQLNLMDKTLADLARDAQVERCTLYHCFLRPYPRMEHYIAKAVGLRPQELFPERYDEHGLPNGRGMRVQASCRHGGKDSCISATRNLQDKEAA